MTHATLIDALQSHVATRGDTVFTRHLTSAAVEELTFRQFAALAGSYGAHYRAAGAGKGDVVLIFLPTSPQVLPAFVGAMMIGAVPSLMPLPSAKQHPSVYWASHRTLLDRIRPRLLLTDRDHAAQMADHGLAEGRTILAIEDLRDDIAPAAPVDIDGADIALLQHSSGTTALKKGVALSHDAILKQAASYAARLGATADDAIVSWLPIYHDMGLIACSMVPLVLGQTVTILDPFQWVGRPATLFDAIQRYDGRFVWMPNFAFEHLTRAVPPDYSGDLSRVRAFIDCSEPCKTETFDRFAERFAGIGVRRDSLQVCYAMAETVFAVTQTAPGSSVGSLVLDRDAIQQRGVAIDAAVGGTRFTVLSNGTAIDGITVEIHDEAGRPLGGDSVGEIVVSGDFLFTGYHNDAATTAERLHDGRYRTRDMGFVRDGELYVLGRTDDLLIVGGRNLHAHEVEEIVGAVPGLKPGRAVAFGVYNATNASEDLVIVAERDDETVDAGEIGRLVREAVFDRTNIDVKDLAVVAPGWLTKTTSGKISRERNKARYLEGLAADTAHTAAAAAPETDTFGEIAAIIARTFRCQSARISRDTVAADISGWDSLAHSTLILEVERDLEIRFPDDEIFGFDTVGALVDRAAQLRAEGGDAPDRILAEDENFSILVMGEANDDAPDLIIFAGAALKFGGRNMMDFASTMRGTIAEKSRRFFVTDRHRHWFTDSLEPISAALNAASPGPKIVFGNSMGGYGALAHAPLLTNVVSVLSFVPQHAPKPRIAAELGRLGEQWYVCPAPGVPTCIVFGEMEDDVDKAWIDQAFADRDLHTLLRVNNCGHNVVNYLNAHGLLAPALTTALDAATMRENLTRVVESIAPSQAELVARYYHLNGRKRRLAVDYLVARYPDALDAAEPPANPVREKRREERRRNRGGRDRD